MFLNNLSRLIFNYDHSFILRSNFSLSLLNNYTFSVNLRSLLFNYDISFSLMITRLISKTTVFFKFLLFNDIPIRNYIIRTVNNLFRLRNIFSSVIFNNHYFLSRFWDQSFSHNFLVMRLLVYNIFSIF
jgi:hypothetical protein